MPRDTSRYAGQVTGALLVLATSARLTRFVVTDTLGKWWIKDPIDTAMAAYEAREVMQAELEERKPVEPWWWRYREGLDCPWCVGFWIALGVTVSHRLIGHTALWRILATALSVNYVAAHVGVRLGDTAGDDDDDD